MFYREVGPRVELSAFINCYWMIQAHQPGVLRDRTFPDGCQEIVFHINSTVRRSDNNGRDYSVNPQAELVGQMTKPYDIITHGHQIYFGAKFFPHSFSPFIRESIHNLRDRSISLYELMPFEFTQAIDTVFNCPTFDCFVSSMERYFMRALSGLDLCGKSYRTVDRAVNVMFKNKQRIRIDDLHHELGVSQRYLQNEFKLHVGLTPKQLFRMIRFQTAFRHLHDSHLPLTEVALRCGYYDHAHFTHEFNMLAGDTPSAYRGMESPFNRFFLDESSRAYLCNFKD